MALDDWDVTKPIDHLKISSIPSTIRDVKSSTKVIIAKEHIQPSTNNSGGQHVKGSARVFLQSDTPVLDPEGNSLDTSGTSDNGRLAVLTGDNNALKVFIGGASANWQDVAVRRVLLSAGTQSDQPILAGQLDTSIFSIETTSTGIVRILPAYLDDRFEAYVTVSDQKIDADGGDASQATWHTRDLNTKGSDVYNLCTLTDNQIVLAAGTYRCSISCPAFRVNKNFARLYNVTNAVEVLRGTAEHANGGYPGGSRSWIVGQFTIEVAKVLEVQHYCQDGYSPAGLGLKASEGINVYTVAEFWKIN